MRYPGLSECGADLLRCPHAMYPITAVHSEDSLCTRDAEDDLIAVLGPLAVKVTGARY